MKRDLVSFSQQHDTLPADPSTFYETKTPEERKRLAAIAQENRNMEEWFARWRKIQKIHLTVELLRKHKNGAWIQITQHPLQKIIFELLVKGKVKTQLVVFGAGTFSLLSTTPKKEEDTSKWSGQSNNKKRKQNARLCVCVSEYVLPLSLPRRCRETPRARYPLRRRCGGCLFSFVLAFSGSRPAIDKRRPKVTLGADRTWRERSPRSEKEWEGNAKEVIEESPARLLFL